MTRIKLKVDVKDRIVTYQWTHRLRGIKGRRLILRFQSDMSMIPKHIWNYIFVIFFQDALTSTGGILTLDELTVKEHHHLWRTLNLNREASGCAGRSRKNIMTIQAQDYVNDVTKWSGSKKIICANGFGKDGINTILLTKELGYKPIPFTLMNQYRSQALSIDRLTTAYSFYIEEDLVPEFIDTNYFEIRDRTIGFYPYAIGIPLAITYKSNVVLDGIQIHNNKIRISDGSFYCPGETHIAFKHAGLGAGLRVSSPMRPLSNFGAQKLLAERWPEYLPSQRSCMHGIPWCSECAKCNRKALYLKALGIDPSSVGLEPFDPNKLGFHTYGPVHDSVRQVLLKIYGHTYNPWIDGANLHALEAIWEGQRLKEILKEHFHLYTKDPGPDNDGFILEPSKWRDLFHG